MLPPALSFAHAVPCARMCTPSLHEVTVPAPQVSAMEPLHPLMAPYSHPDYDMDSHSLSTGHMLAFLGCPLAGCHS